VYWFGNVGGGDELRDGRTIDDRMVGLHAADPDPVPAILAATHRARSAGTLSTKCRRFDAGTQAGWCYGVIRKGPLG
jgi:hypothetical protein